MIWFSFLVLIGYNIKENDLLQSIRTCPLCQAIFHGLSMDEQQFQQHIKAHSYQKRK